MQLLYFITTVTSQVHSARHHQRVGYSALPSVSLLNVIMFNNLYYVKRKSASINLPEELIGKATLLKVATKLFDFS